MSLQAVREIFKGSLHLQSSERVLVFTDKPAAREQMDSLPQDEQRRRLALRDVAHMVEESARGMCEEVIYLEYPATGAHGVEPPRPLWEAAFGKEVIDLLEKEGLLKPLLKKTATKAQQLEIERIVLRNRIIVVDCVVALANYSTSHTQFRDLLTRVCDVRYASMPMFDARMFEGPLSVDITKMARRTRAVATALTRARAAEVSTPDGTRIAFSIRGRKAYADTGILKRPGSFGNLPAGEGFIAPVEGTANGTLVLNWAPHRKLSSPVTVTVKDGMATSVKGSDPFADELRAHFEERAENANLAEFGVGTNDRASRAENILESEKIMGTIHFAFGDNSSFGGKTRTPYHQDFVFFRPTVKLDNPDGTFVDLLLDGQLQGWTGLDT